MSQHLAPSRLFRPRILVGCLGYQLFMFRTQLAGNTLLPVTDVEDTWVNNGSLSQELSILDHLFHYDCSFSSLLKLGLDVSKIHKRKHVHWMSSVDSVQAPVIQKWTRPSPCLQDACRSLRGDKEISYYHIIVKSYHIACPGYKRNKVEGWAWWRIQQGPSAMGVWESVVCMSKD